MTPIPYTPGCITALYVLHTVQAGFASPAEDHATKRIYLLEHIARHPQATFQFKVRGESMRTADIFDGDMNFKISRSNTWWRALPAVGAGRWR